jgi:hypothetical protein
MKNPTELTKEAKLNLIYRHTSRDYKNNAKGDDRAILVLRAGGTHLVPLIALTDAEIEDKLTYALYKEDKKRTEPAYYAYNESGMRNGSAYRVAARGMFAHYINGDYVGMVVELPNMDMVPFTKKEAKTLLPVVMGGKA